MTGLKLDLYSQLRRSWWFASYFTVRFCLLFLFMCMAILLTCMSVYYMHVWCPEGGVSSLEWELQLWVVVECWEWNPRSSRRASALNGVWNNSLALRVGFTPYLFPEVDWGEAALNHVLRTREPIYNADKRWCLGQVGFGLWGEDGGESTLLFSFTSWRILL